MSSVWSPGVGGMIDPQARLSTGGLRSLSSSKGASASASAIALERAVEGVEERASPSPLSRLLSRSRLRSDGEPPHFQVGSRIDLDSLEPGDRTGSRIRDKGEVSLPRP